MATAAAATTTVEPPAAPADPCQDAAAAPLPSLHHQASSAAAADAVAAAAAPAGLSPPIAGLSKVAIPAYDPARAQAIADEITAGALARLAANAASGAPLKNKWFVSSAIWEAGSGAGVHVGAALEGEGESDGCACYGVGGDGVEGVVSVGWVRI